VDGYFKTSTAGNTCALLQQQFVHPHSDNVSVLGPREVVCVVAVQALHATKVAHAGDTAVLKGLAPVLQ
jgi:hypothetical protein